MRTGENTGGIFEQKSGFMPPAPGEGMYICNKCNNSFFNSKKGFLSDIFGGLFVKCPKCGSLETERDTKFVY
jgi:DNA-directed RNA polymerase subunit RPC12/RpoP